MHPDNRVFLVGTTNHPEDIDTRLLRGGRFSGKLTIRYPMSSIEYSFSIAFSRASACQKGLTISDVARHSTVFRRPICN